MRHLSDEELAKYFDEETEAPSQASPRQGGWSLDDAFANPHQGRADSAPSEPDSQQIERVSQQAERSFDPNTPAPLKRPRLSDRQLHPVSRVSRVSEAPFDTEGLTWTGRDANFEKPSGFGGKPVMLMVAMVALCLVMVMMFGGGGGGGPISGNLPQIGQ